MSGDTNSILRQTFEHLKSIVSFDTFAAAARQATDDLPSIKLEKTDGAVNYRDGAPAMQCFGCRHYQWGACSLVEGIIGATGVCDLHREPVAVVPPELLADAALSDQSPDAQLAREAIALSEVAGGTEGTAWRLFVAAETASAPERVPLLPKPGLYRHPAYGDIAMDAATIDRFVANVNTGVYQRQLPVDAEHQTKLSGALGWIQRAEVNAEGGADAVVEWTDRGRALLADNRFKYVSPEWYPTWRDPATGQEHKNVLVALALTTRPFFKDAALRPLVASDGGLVPGDDPVQALREEPMNGEQNTVAASEPETLRFAELERRASEAEAALQAAELKLVEVAQAEQRRAFTDEVLGRSAENGTQWFGEADTHVAILEALPAELRAGYIAHQRRVAAELAQSPLLAAVGSDLRPAGDGTAWSVVDARARAFREQHPGMTEAQAIASVVAADPALYARYQDEKRGATAVGE